MIRLDIIPSNFQLSLTSYSYTTSFSLFRRPIIIWLELFPDNFHLYVTSSRYDPALETASKDIPPPRYPTR